jgi:hypothetical protein
MRQPACDAQLRAGRQPRELTRQAGADPRTPQRGGAQLSFELGSGRDQVPAQPVDHPGALADDLIAVIGQHPNLQRMLIGERHREALHPVSDHR